MNLFKSLRAVTAALALAFTAGAALAADENHVKDGYGANGYDPVAYFTEDAAVVGADEFTAEHDGVSYRFASAENRDLFLTDPAKYAPQYGGFCAFGLAMGRKFPTDPTAFAVVDDKLYLNLNPKIQQRWKADIPGFIKGADNNWEIVRAIPDAELEKASPDGVTVGAQ